MRWCSDGVSRARRTTKPVFAATKCFSYPEHIGVRIPAGTLLLINAHYINATGKVLEPEIAINLHTVPEKELEQEGGLIFWYNPFIKVPANGESETPASCPIDDDIHITNAQSHMHRRGVDYAATIIDPDGERNMFYASDRWEDVMVESYEPSLEVPAGSRVEWRCGYENKSGTEIYQGARSTDEMCMLIGAYYPRKDEIGFCFGEKRGPFMRAQWNIGQGTATCKESFSCVVAANLKYGSMDGTTTGRGAQALTSAITDCLLASDPKLAAPVSDMIGCLASAPSDVDPIANCTQEIDVCNGQ